MPRSPLSSLAVAVLAAGSLSVQRPDAGAKAKVTMRFAPAVGAVSHCTLRAETAAENEEIGTMEAKLRLHCERTVVAAKDGVVTLRYRFLRVVGSQVQTRPAREKQEATYDSDKDKGQPSPQFPDIAEDTMVCKVDARGRIVEVEAPDGMTRQSISPFALNGDPASFVRLFAFELPAAAVAAGDGWSPKWAVGMGSTSPSRSSRPASWSPWPRARPRSRTSPRARRRRTSVGVRRSRPSARRPVRAWTLRTAASAR